jgi:hypothetical protein
MATRKLYSAHHEPLGTITYPNCWDEFVQKHAFYLFPHFGDKRNPSLTDYANGAPFVPHTALSRDARDPSGVNLWGMTPQEFGRLRDCSYYWVPRHVVSRASLAVG